ncbi:MAG: hypothetical protein G01um101433_69 [Parcubacteria group bacterium Gr01-1014_33]|nr:MAG: hypothetical protein G01um101433_69 [Parcubacteria group bacterium Gr01-1014_33]
MLPDEFFENPTKWIESQRNIERGYENETVLLPGEKIGELFDFPYDVSKVKELTFDTGEKKIKMVSKRLNPKESGEIALARKAWEAGIPTAKVLGEILDRDNLYAFFEKINGINLEAALIRKELEHLPGIPPVGGSKKEFFDGLSDTGLYPYSSYLSNRARQEIEKWYKKVHLIETRHKIVADLYSVVYNTERDARIAAMRSDSIRISSYVERDMQTLRATHPRTILTRVLRRYGCDTLNSFLDVLIEKGKTRDWDFFNQLLEKFDSERYMLRQRIAARKYEFNLLVYQDILGMDPFKTRDEFEELLGRKGVEHKDLAYRNIIIE